MFVYSPTKQSSQPDPARRDHLRSHNTAILLRLLWADTDGRSRADLARATGLSRATVSAITTELLATGMVLEGALRASRGGRPGTTLRFQSGGRTILGIELGASHVSAVRTDLHGKVLDKRRREHDVQGDPEGSLALLDRFMTELIATAEAAVLGIGIGVPSPLRSDRPGRLSRELLPRWAEIDLLGWVRERQDLPVYIDNDANVGALAEHWWGAGQGVEDFAYLKVATGVGAGIIIQGDIFRGAGGIAGEIGHTAIDPSGPRCRCGLHGCLEALVGTQYLLERAARRAQTLPETPPWADPEPHLAGLIEAAEQGDPVARELIATTGHWLGIAVSNLLNLVNPSRVVLGGRLTAAGEFLLGPLRAAIAERALWTSVESAQVVISTLPTESVALGAATLVLQQALSAPDALLRSPQTAVTPLT